MFKFKKRRDYACNNGFFTNISIYMKSINPKLIKSSLMIIFLGLSGISLGGCKQHEAADTKATDTSVSVQQSSASTSKETMAQTKSSDSSDIKKSESKSSDTKNSSKTTSKESSVSIKSTLKNFTEGKTSIQYPVLSGIDDASKLAKINGLIEDNARSIINAMGIDSTEDTLDIKANIINSDRKRISISYTGTLKKASDTDKTNIFYSNTIDLDNAANLSLKDFADPYTIAGYVLSDDVEIVSSYKSASDYFMQHRADTGIDYYTKLFSEADFPLKTENGKKIFPKSFSYIKNGDVYVSIPTDHTSEDYILVKFSPSSK